MFINIYFYYIVKYIHIFYHGLVFFGETATIYFAVKIKL